MPRTLIVDGSNIATEGRSLPSLEQLNIAVTSFLSKHAFDTVVVIVDATFAHRIDASERVEFEEAILAGELVSPPAGAIGRGDAFILQVADDHTATVLSNDSFQEFHGTYDWLFEEGRLWGGKPLGTLGWSFVARTPVRGPSSRRAVREARTRGGPTPTPDTAAKLKAAPGEEPKIGDRRRGAPKPVTVKKGSASIGASAKGGAPRPSTTPADGAAGSTVLRPATGTRAAGPASTGSRRGRGRSRSADSQTGATIPEGAADAQRRRPRQPVNEPVPFLGFVTEHRLGSTVSGTVMEFSSHGAYIEASGHVATSR